MPKPPSGAMPSWFVATPGTRHPRLSVDAYSSHLGGYALVRRCVMAPRSLRGGPSGALNLPSPPPPPPPLQRSLAHLLAAAPQSTAPQVMSSVKKVEEVLQSDLGATGTCVWALIGSVRALPPVGTFVWPPSGPCAASPQHPACLHGPELVIGRSENTACACGFRKCRRSPDTVRVYVRCECRGSSPTCTTCGRNATH